MAMACEVVMAMVCEVVMVMLCVVCVCALVCIDRKGLLSFFDVCVSIKV